MCHPVAVAAGGIGQLFTQPCLSAQAVGCVCVSPSSSSMGCAAAALFFYFQMYWVFLERYEQQAVFSSAAEADLSLLRPFVWQQLPHL
jgi:hypothetical protein